MYCISDFLILGIVFNSYFIASYPNWLHFKGGYVAKASHLNVDFHPYIFEDSNCLQVEV
jgi:hypothetical protein